MLAGVLVPDLCYDQVFFASPHTLSQTSSSYNSHITTRLTRNLIRKHHLNQGYLSKRL
jgi:hypothetical protein